MAEGIGKMRKKYGVMVVFVTLLMLNSWLYAEERIKTSQPKMKGEPAPQTVTTAPDPEFGATMEKFLRELEQEERSLGNTPEEIRQAKIASAVEQLKDPDYVVRRGAAASLAWLGAQEHAKEIVPLLKDADSRVRFVAAYALGELGSKEYVADIADLLDDQDEMVRRDAVEALGKLGAAEYASDIVLLLNDSGGHVVLKGQLDYTVRGTAATALGRLGAKEYAKDVTRLLNDKEWAVRRSAEQVLEDWDTAPKP